MNLRIQKVFDRYSVEGPPIDAVECAAWFQRRVEGIPFEFRSGARIEIEAQGGGCDEPAYTTIVVSWERPETPAEETSRVQEAALKAIQQERLERHTLAILREKYP